MSVQQYISTAKHGPIRYDTLRPGSFFRIVAEPSRKIKKSQDQRMYKKALDGFYSTLADDETHGVVLMPGDLVEPFKLVRIK